MPNKPTELSELTEDQLRQAISKLGGAAPPKGAPKAQLIDALHNRAWTLSNTHTKANQGPSNGVGACRYSVNGQPQCCNLTSEECSAIPGTFDPQNLCPL
jgi:hypothetical protein